MDRTVASAGRVVALASAGRVFERSASAVAALAVAAALCAVATPGLAAASGTTGPAADCTPDATRALVVTNASTGECLLAVPVANGTAVALEYTHSVEKTRVLDGYEVRGDRLVMVRMEFESYGAGLPASADVNRTADGAFVFDPPGAYEELYVQPGRIAGHVLHVANRSYDLVALSNASTVRLSVAGPAHDGSNDDGR